MAEETKPDTSNTDDDKKFVVNSRAEILRILRSLVHGRDSVSAVSRGGQDVLLTAVVGVDADNDVMYLDTNINKDYNAPLLASKRTIFVSLRDGIKVQWVGTEVEMSEFEGREAFRLAIPETLRYVQKRGLFRIDTPRIKPVTCRIPLGEDKFVDVALMDICAEGIGVVLPDAPVAEMKKGATFVDCALNIPEVGVVPINLIVMGAWETKLKNGAVIRRAGLGFVDALPGTQSKVQRYINVLQRNRIATKVDR